MLSKFVVVALAAAFTGVSVALADVNQQGNADVKSLSEAAIESVQPAPGGPVCGSSPGLIDTRAINLDGIVDNNDKGDFIIVRRAGFKRDDSLILLEPTVVPNADGTNVTMYNTLSYAAPTNTVTVYLTTASPIPSAETGLGGTETETGAGDTTPTAVPQTPTTASDVTYSATITGVATTSVFSTVPAHTQTVTGTDTQTETIPAATLPSITLSDLTNPPIVTTDGTSIGTDTTLSEITSVPTEDQTTTPSTLVIATGTPSSATSHDLTTPSSSGITTHTTHTGPTSATGTPAPSTTVPASNGVRTAKAGGAMLFGLGGLVALLG